MLFRPGPLLLALSLLLAGCPSEQTNRIEATRAKKGAAKAEATGPEAPLALATKPVTGDRTLPTEVALRTPEGQDTTLGALLAGNSIVVYFTPDTKDRANRAAHRILRDVSRGGDAMGFRLLLVFSEGTQPEQIDEFYRSRKIRRIGRAAIDADGAFARASGWEPRSGALVGPDGQIGAFFGPTDRYDSRLGMDGGLNADLLFRAWEPAQGAPAVSDADKAAAVGLVRAVLQGAPIAADSALPDSSALSTPIASSVYVSLYRPGEIRRLRGSSSAPTLGQAVTEATRAALLTAGEGAASWQARPDVRFAVDVTGPAQALPTRDSRALWYLVEPGIDGVVLGEGAGAGVVLPHEPVTQGFLTPRVRNRDKKLEAIFKEAARRGGLAAAAWTESSTPLMRFRSTSFGVTGPGTAVVDMHRGNVLMDGPPDEARILESLRLGGLWLVNTVGADGKFDYEYLPNQDKGSTDYNIVRHAGSVYGLFEMYDLSLAEPALSQDSTRYIDAAARAMSYIYEATEAPPRAKEPNRRCLIDNKRCDSGSAALTLMTFLSRPPRDEVPAAYRDRVYRAEDAEIMEGLGLTLVDMIDPSGKVFASYAQAMTDTKVRKEPLYYPGETMLALMKFYEATGDARWLDGARRIGERQASWYADDRFEWPDHWVMQGWYPLWKADKQTRWTETAWDMATHSVSEQYPSVWSPFEDYHGAWRRDKDVPRTTRAGSRLEALRGVVHLAWAAGKDATPWEDALLAGADHLIEKQYRPENVWYLPNPDKAMGAYPMGIVDNHLRIDNNQHALVGMVGALEVLRRRAGK